MCLCNVLCNYKGPTLSKTSAEKCWPSQKILIPQINGTIVVLLVKNRCAVCLLCYHKHTFAIEKIG